MSFVNLPGYFYTRLWIFALMMMDKLHMVNMIDLFPDNKCTFYGIGIGEFYIGVIGGCFN